MRRTERLFILMMLVLIGTGPSCAKLDGPEHSALEKVPDWYESDPLARELSQLTRDEWRRFRESDLIDVRPVALPREPLVESGNDYFDWPIACCVDGTIIVLFNRRRYHFGGEGARMNEDSGIRMITRSTDGEVGRLSGSLFPGWIFFEWIGSLTGVFDFRGSGAGTVRDLKPSGKSFCGAGEIGWGSYFKKIFCPRIARIQDGDLKARFVF